MIYIHQLSLVCRTILHSVIYSPHVPGLAQKQHDIIQTRCMVLRRSLNKLTRHIFSLCALLGCMYSFGMISSGLVFQITWIMVHQGNCSILVQSGISVSFDAP